MGLAKLEENYRSLLTANPREAAEVAYVLAVLLWKRGDTTRARRFAEESIRLFEQLRVETLEEAAARFVTLEGIALPSLIHENVVRERLTPLLNKK